MMVRAWSKSLTRPSVCGKSSMLVGSASFSRQSVHAAGMSERLPSGRLASNRRTPRLRILLMTAKLRPSKAWHFRVMITAFGISR
jgi:hypothetical protein